MKSCSGFDCDLKNICRRFLNRDENDDFFLQPPYVKHEGKPFSCPELLHKEHTNLNGKKVLPDTNDPLLD